MFPCALLQLPFPANFTTKCDTQNNALALLLPDNETLIQMQVRVPMLDGADRGWSSCLHPPRSCLIDCQSMLCLACALPLFCCVCVRMKPLYRENASSPLLGLYFPWGPGFNISILGDGALGAHGGSGLSRWGGGGVMVG